MLEASPSGEGPGQGVWDAIEEAGSSTQGRMGRKGNDPHKGQLFPDVHWVFHNVSCDAPTTTAR